MADTERGVRLGNVWIPVIISVAALVVSFFALRVSWLHYIDDHNLAQAQATPLIETEIAADEDDFPVGVSITNPGPYVVKIKSIAYYLDRKPLQSMDELIDTARLNDVKTEELSNDAVLAVGEKTWLLYVDRRPKGKDGQDDLDHFSDVIYDHLGVEVEVCSVISGNCRKVCSTKGWCS